jgi:hypothetical protein
MSKMISHDPFEYLKHKLWLKERLTFPPNFLAFRWRATYLWKALDKDYNFALNLISIESLHTKLWASKVMGVPILGILGLPLGSPMTK